MSFFPTTPNDGDEIGPNTNGTYFKYSAANDAWYIISNIEISNIDYDEGTWDTNSDGATKNVIRDELEAHYADPTIHQDAPALIAATKLDDLATPDNTTDLDSTINEHGLLKKLNNIATNYMNGQGNWTEPAGEGGGSAKGSMVLVMDIGGGAVKNVGIPNNIDLGGAVGRSINSRFRITENMDATADIKLIISLREKTAGVDPTLTWNVGAYKTDGSEFVGASYNVIDAQAFGADQEGYIETRSVVIPNAAIDQNDVVLIYIVTTNDRGPLVYDLSIEYTEAA